MTQTRQVLVLKEEVQRFFEMRAGSLGGPADQFASLLGFIASRMDREGFKREAMWSIADELLQLFDKEIGRRRIGLEHSRELSSLMREIRDFIQHGNPEFLVKELRKCLVALEARESESTEVVPSAT